MRILSSRNSSASAKPSSSGFTLLEVLVVMTIAAILTGVVVIGFTGAEGGQQLQGHTERVMLRMDLARQRAVTRNREMGMTVEPDRYRFTELDRETGQWLALERRPFSEVTVEDRFRLSLKVEGADSSKDGKKPAAKKSGEEGEDPPDLVFFRSGEITPFTLTVATEDQRRGWQVSSDGLSGIAMARIDEP
ncbi:MAG: type II secretion system minor pseudopilin GspH [Pseudomonadales bacterium]